MGISTQDVIRGLFGVDTTPNINPVTDSVGTSAVKILKNNPRRMSILIQNLSTNTVYIGFKPDVSSTKGILLAANGGSITMQYDKDFQLVTNELFAVASGAASPIIVLENNIIRGV